MGSQVAAGRRLSQGLRGSGGEEACGSRAGLGNTCRRHVPTLRGRVGNDDGDGHAGGTGSWFR